MSTDRAPKKILKDKRSKLEKILDKVSGMGITKSELTKAIRGMKSMNRGNPGVAGASTTKKRMGPIARKPQKEIPVVDPMRYGGMVKKKKKKKK
jgi:hypothetical protein